MTQGADFKDKVHRIRGSLSVLSGFLGTYQPRDEDDKTYLELAKTSLEKLRRTVEEMEGDVILGDRE